MPIISNSKGELIIHSIATETISLANAQSTDSLESTVAGLEIREAHWSTNGSIVVSRGANTCLNLFGSGTWEIHGVITHGVNAGDLNATLIITINSSGTLILKVGKTY